jgi:hypothetical protein
MATFERGEYSRYDDLLDAVYRTRDWWRTVHILERALIFVAVLFAAVAAVTLLEAHLHLSAALRWPLCIALVGYLALGLVFLVFRPLFREWTEEEVAVHIERKYPELDNQVINALQLGTDRKVLSPAMVDALVAEAAENVQRLQTRQAVSTRRMRWMAAAAFAATVALGLWAALSFGRFSNALQRVMFPSRDIAALGLVKIAELKPGDTRINSGSDLEVTVRTQGGPSGEIDAVLRYRYEDAEEGLEKPMSPVSSDVFVARIEEVKTPLSYFVNIGGTESKTYHVAVVERPLIVQRGIQYDYPSYATAHTDWEDHFDPDTNGNIRAPGGTVVTLKFTTNKTLTRAQVRRSNGDELEAKIRGGGKQMEATFSIAEDGTYTVHMVDEDDLSNLDPREHKIVALPDRAPLIEFSAPGKDIEVGLDESVKLALRTSDDYGVDQVSLFARRGKEGAQRAIKTWTELATPRRMALPFAWDLSSSEAGYQVGDEVFYYAVARDNHAEVSGTREIPKPQETKTAEFKITIVDKEQIAEEKKKALSTWETELRKVLEDQITARDSVRSLEREQEIPRLHKQGGRLAEAQTDIATRTINVAKSIEPTDPHTQAIRESIELLAYGEMTQAVRRAQSIAKLDALQDVKQAYADLETSQDKIISALRRILNILPDVAEEDKEKMAEEDVEDFPDDQEEALKDLLKGLKDMVRDKKKVKETTDELAKLPMEDFTPEDEKKLEDIKAIEEKWSQFLKSKISDLSKMQEQDFANTTLLDELIEIHSEVEMAKDALSSKATEIATALEDNGLMMAEKLTKQLEKWLPDTPDRDRWQMEEPLTDGFETPMAELPKELEDLVGDLMEEEEDLMQEVEDATSAWADSMDAAGWDAMDGPISNFAANGVTGNRLPNSSELSGRSGEGRQGQSVGEMVENQFDGKGGRRTPTRLTSEAFQKGQVKDTSNTPPGGATGGGKTGGASGEGLEGPVPPDIELKLKNMALKQAQLRNKAEQIAIKFEVLNYPPVFEPVVKNMQVLEEALNSGRYMGARRRYGVVLKNMKGTRMFLDGELALDQVRSPTLPAHLQDEIVDTAGAAVPDEFKEHVKNYYEAISATK